MRPSIRNSDEGYTVLEVLVAATLSLIIIGAAFGATSSLRKLYAVDLARTRLNQDVRSALDFVGVYVRQTGERLPQGVLAVEIIDGALGAPDELILRRNILDEVLTVCETIPAGSSNSTIALTTSLTGASPACVYGGQSQSFSVWQAERAAKGGTLKVYLYNVSTKEGEFVDYVSETDSGSSMAIQRAPGAVTYQYDAEASGVYLMVEWRIQLDFVAHPDGVLQVIENEDVVNAKRIVHGITDFQLQAIMQDGSVLQSFGVGDDWSELESVEIAVSGEDQLDTITIETELRSRFFPRNILSL